MSTRRHIDYRMLREQRSVVYRVSYAWLPQFTARRDLSCASSRSSDTFFAPTPIYRIMRWPQPTHATVSQICESPKTYGLRSSAHAHRIQRLKSRLSAYLICLPPCAVSPFCRNLSEPTTVLSEECPNPWRKGPCQLCTERFLLRAPLCFGCSVGVAREGAKPCLLVL